MKHLIFGTLSTVLLTTTLVQPGLAIESAISSQDRTEEATLIANKVIVSSGEFVTVEKETTGSAQIITKDGKRYVEFSSDFSTGNGPDVKVILYRDASTPAAIEEGSYISLALIKSFNGKQLFAIPDEINLEEYGSIALWCEEFNITFGYASLG